MPNINSFTALDFETAHGKHWSICQVGLVKVVNGEVADKLEMLIQPPDNYYWKWFTDDIHGISPKMTKNAPTFDKAWAKIKPFIEGQDVVAHNMAFDGSCLEQALDYYRIKTVNYRQHCTYSLYRTNLASLCKEFGIELDHHNALSDALACAELFKLHLMGEGSPKA